MTPITDLLELVVGGERIATSARPAARRGGEWDAWYAVPLRKRQRLTGAGWARRRGMAPDQLADVIRQTYPHLSDSECVEWYVRTALLAIDESRRARRAARTARFCARIGARSYYAYRDVRCVLAGWPSFWAWRKAGYPNLSLAWTPPNQ